VAYPPIKWLLHPSSSFSTSAGRPLIDQHYG